MQKRYYKYMPLVALLVILLCILACQSNKAESYPEMKQMEANLDRKKYNISIIQTLESLGGGEYLIGEKADDYIEFYWLKDSSHIETVVSSLAKKYTMDKVNVLKDPKDASVSMVYIGSERAIADAGVKRVSTN